MRIAGPWFLGLSTWLAGHAAWAQMPTWGEVLARRSYSAGGPPTVRADDPDLVRAGAFAQWSEAIARGATARVDAALDLDGDGVVDRLLTVSPCADPYPYDTSAGLVLVRHTPEGFRATVLLREEGVAAWGAVRRGRRALVAVGWSWTEGHASEGFVSHAVEHRFRLERDGTLRWVDACASHADGDLTPPRARDGSASGPDGYGSFDEHPRRCR